MKSIVWIKRLSQFLSLAILASCTVNPVTGERELSLISPQQAMQMGIQNYQPGQQSQGGVYYLDRDLSAYINRVGQRLAAVSDVPNLPYEFVVLNNDVPNAWAMPGGKIAINRGLLTELEDEAQLASVLGHEIVHAAANHGAAQMSRSALLSVGMLAAGVMASDHEYGSLIMVGSQIGSAAWMANYGRDDELESDRYGMLYMSRAGYDPQAAVELQQTFVHLSEGRSQDFISGLFASHPPSQSRVDANHAHAANLPAGGERGRDAYQRAIAQITRDQPAYDAQQRAVEALNNNQPRQALTELDEAIRIQPDEGQFWETRGHAWKMLEDYTNAETAYSTAIRKNENYYQHWLARGLLRQERRLPGAQEDLQRAQDLLPTSSGAYALGQLAEANNDFNTALSYYRSVAEGGGQLGQQAQYKILRYELPQVPDRYISSGLDATTTNNLRIMVRNDSPLAVSNVVVRLYDRNLGTSRDFNVPGSLRSGEQIVLDTGIAASTRTLAVQVVRARLVE